MALAGLIMGYISIAAIPLILIIAAIAIPSLLRARMLANESAAASTVRTINTAQSTYSSVYGKGYAADLATLGSGSQSSCAQPSHEHACLLDHVVANSTCRAGAWCTRQGYEFNVTATCGADGSCSEYVITATPVQQGTSGTKNFCSTSDLIIREQSVAGAMVAPPTATECQSWPPLSP
jgi:type II secretory pathway pseudopilin PulG